MTISIKTFATMVSDAATAIQGAAASLLDLSVGSVLRAYVEAQAAMALWLQGIALQIAALARFATSNGADADTWAADFGFARLAANASSGTVTFARFTATVSATVPVGTLVQTADGTQQYVVVADTAKVAYSAVAGGYVLGVGVASITATVKSTAPAAAGNAVAGAINTLASSIAGVDTVTNTVGFTNGSDAESDIAFRARFPVYLNGLAGATYAAISSAIQGVQTGITFTITENMSYAGAAQPGYFYVVVDDGTGAPSAGFLALITAAVDTKRPLTSTFGVFAPSILTANVAMTLTTAVGYTHSVLVANVQAALLAYINALSLGQPLPFSRLAQVAYGTSAGITNVTGVTLNSGGADLAATSQQLIRAGTLAIS